MAALPAYRRILLTCGTTLWAFGVSWRVGSFSQVIDTAVVLLLAGILFHAAIRFPHSWFGRRPILALFGGFAAIVLLANEIRIGGRMQSEMWKFLQVLDIYAWFIGYSLLDRNSKDRDNFTLQLGTYQPFWRRETLPYKGAAYLRRIEARNPEGLAIAQIKGVKLLAWSYILNLVLIALGRVVHGYLGIPNYSDLLALSVQRVSFPWYVGWASLVSVFFEKILTYTIWGHRAVACWRMAGFMALRNTCRPLESRSIAEFWNRYIYYFKEFLVDFFFYPTFVRYFKRWPRLRLFAATFAAACLGNFFCHFFLDLPSIERFGFWKALAEYDVYFFYTTVLAIGIGISQLRRRQQRPGWIRGRLLPTSCVIGFYCILQIFDDTTRAHPIQEHFRFLAHLFNLVS